jgi:hypothetical protein
MRYAAVLSLVAVCSLGPSARADEKSVDEGLKAILAVGKEGAGNAAAAAGWKAVVAGKADALIPTLKAFAGASPAARNWLRSAVAAIAEGEKAANSTVILGATMAFVQDRSQDRAARVAAYDFVVLLDPKKAERLVGNEPFRTDPCVELRRIHIANRMAKPDQEAEWDELFTASRDFDQVEKLAPIVEKQMGKPVDLPGHFGFIQTWHVVGPFDSTDGAGFAKSFLAESGFNPAKVYPGKDGKDVGWKTITAEPKHPNYDPKGSPFYAYVDLNKELGKSMDAVGYAASQFTIEKETPCEIRVGCQNAIQIFLNGKKLFEREAYHHGYYPDQHVCSGTLKAGRNELVLKVLQNNQKETWAQYWAFNCRVCDATGGSLPIKTYVPPMPAGEGKK